MPGAATMIREQSVKSLPVSTRANGKNISTATAFVAVHQGEHYLVTNWHVAAGRRPDDGSVLSKSGAVPDDLSVLHNVAGKLGHWEQRLEPLYDGNGDPLWLEHPVCGRQVDVVALPLTETKGVDIFPYDPINPGPLISFGPSDTVSIIGFPFGRSGGGGLGIWVQGTIATEPAIDYLELPCFLVDSRTREGQSGSPVILYRPTGYSTEDANMVLTGQPAERFIGVYSGRINEESDLGSVWKANALAEILTAQKRGLFPKISPVV